MAHADSSIVIIREPADVYAFLVDGLNNPKWRPGVSRIELTSGAVGTRYEQEMTGPGGRTIRGDYEITDVVKDTEFGFAVVAGPARPTGRYRLEANGTGTKLTFSLDYAPKGLMKLLSSMIQRTMDQEVAQLGALKAVLEHA